MRLVPLALLALSFSPGAAAGPIAIDSLVTTLSIDDSAYDDRRPEVAYDASLDLYLLVWERHFNQADVDIHAQVLDGDGNLLRECAIDLSPGRVYEVQVAGIDAADQFLIAYRTAEAWSDVVGRTVDVGLAPLTLSLGPPVDLLEYCDNFELAGDPTTTPPLWYCIAGENRFLGSSSIDVRLVGTDGLPQPKKVYGGDPEAYEPRLSKARAGPDDGPKHWGLLVERGFGNPQSIQSLHVVPGPQGLQFEQVQTVAFGTGDIATAAVSSMQDAVSGDRVHVALWEYIPGLRTELYARVVRDMNLGPAATIGAGPNTSFEQAWIDGDGSTLVVVHVERVLFDDLGTVYASTYVVEGSSLVLTERVPLSNGDAPLSAARVISTHSHGGEPGRFFAVWQATPGTHGDIEGALYDTPGPGLRYCVGAPNSIGSGATIHAAGSISIGRNDLRLLAEGCPPGQTGIFYLGTTSIQLPFGEGFRCIGGVTARITPVVTVDPGGTAAVALDFTQPYGGLVTPGLPATRYQLWYRDPAGGPAAFNLSDALRIDHTP